MALALTSGLPGSIHGHLDGSVVGGHLCGVGEHGDGQCETLPWGGVGNKEEVGTWSYSRHPEALIFQKEQVSLL